MTDYEKLTPTEKLFFLENGMNYESNNILGLGVRDIIQLKLGGCFIWGLTPQGYRYWKHVDDRISLYKQK